MSRKPECFWCDVPYKDEDMCIFLWEWDYSAHEACLEREYLAGNPEALGWAGKDFKKLNDMRTGRRLDIKKLFRKQWICPE